VGNYSLGGGGFESRLTKEVRAKRGWAYGVSSQFNPQRQAGPFQVVLQTEVSQADAAVTLVRDILADYVRTGPTEAELQQAKDNLIGGFALRTDSNARLLDWLATIAIYDLPLNFLDDYPKQVEAVTVAGIREAWQRRVDIKALNTLIVGGETSAANPQTATAP
jgi:zinc protease